VIGVAVGAAVGNAVGLAVGGAVWQVPSELHSVQSLDSNSKKSSSAEPEPEPSEKSLRQQRPLHTAEEHS